MLDLFRRRDVMVRVFLGFVVGSIALMMVITMVPGPVGSLAESPNAIAEVGGRQVTLDDVSRRLQRLERVQPIAGPLRAFYARQIVDQLVFTHLLEMEAQRLGIRVTDEERAERIRLLIPTAFEGDRFVGMERYSTEVENRIGMTVGEFEEAISQSLLEEKFRRLVTDGITVSPQEVEEEFRRRNEKVKLEYVVVKPEELQAQVPVADAELAAYFEKNKARYTVPERRSARFLLLDMAELRQQANVSDNELRAYYNEHIERYRIKNRVRVSHLLFKTIGKTDAEIAETQKKAEDALAKARRPGAKFEELARQFSEDTATSGAGGDLGWILEGQTVPEFEKTAFSLPKGATSDLVKTMYGFHIIRAVDRESARTRSFEEVRGEILPLLSAEKAERVANEKAKQLSSAVNRSSRRPLEEIAREFGLAVRETPPAGVGEPLGELGMAPEVSQTLFRLRQQELGGPVRTDRGFVVFTVKEIQAVHPGTLAEVRNRVADDYRRDRSSELAKARAEELGRKMESGGNFAQVARSMGLEMKTSELVARSGSIPEVGSLRQLGDAFTVPVGTVSKPAFLGARWVVHRVAAREAARPEELIKQFAEIQGFLLNGKRQLAYDSFRTALQERMRAEGKLQFNEQNLKRLTSPA
jgi:peptidyl-prolyl cis-trans isomerase D